MTTPTDPHLPSSGRAEDNIVGPATFLFTDIEGSTEKWEQEPERMAKAVAAHDVLLRGAVEENRGRVIKTSGDGILAVFADPVDGVAAVVAIQLALADPALARTHLFLPMRADHANSVSDDIMFAGEPTALARKTTVRYELALYV